MLPYLAKHNQADELKANAILPGQALLHCSGSITGANLNHLLRCEFSHWVKCSSRVKLSVTLNHLFGVFERRAQMKMVRINAGWIVAGMQDLSAWWDRAIVNLPRYPMSHQCGAASLANARLNLPVAKLVSGALPKPTSISFKDPVLKAGGKAARRSCLLWPRGGEIVKHINPPNSLAQLYHICIFGVVEFART